MNTNYFLLNILSAMPAFIKRNLLSTAVLWDFLLTMARHVEYTHKYKFVPHRDSTDIIILACVFFHSVICDLKVVVIFINIL